VGLQALQQQIALLFELCKGLLAIVGVHLERLVDNVFFTLKLSLSHMSWPHSMWREILQPAWKLRTLATDRTVTVSKSLSDPCGYLLGRLSIHGFQNLSLPKSGSD